jgi:topoisomerase-4 subunit B
MGGSRSDWMNTTHDWSALVDHGHLADIRAHRERYAPGGLVHLVLEVVAYADDEAEASDRTGQCTVTLYRDGSVAVADDGRGTDTRLDEDGRPVRKPVMATKDLRFFDGPPAAHLPDGAPRRGMSVVAALSEWLIHTNRRRNGSWTQRYANGVPVTGLVTISEDGATGTTVHFLPCAAARPSEPITPAELRGFAAGFPHLNVLVVTA